jgi:acyl-CoA reductase-like NAD-dependent aldehyde dehydrogenase
MRPSLGLIGDSQRFRFVLKGGHPDHRPKDLLLEGAHIVAASYIQIAREEGGQILTGGERAAIAPALDNGFYIQPPIMVSVSNGSPRRICATFSMTRAIKGS